MAIDANWEKKSGVHARDFEAGKRVRILTSSGIGFQGVVVADKSRHFLTLDQSGEPGLDEDESWKVRIAVAHVVSVRVLEPIKDEVKEEVKEERNPDEFLLLTEKDEPGKLVSNFIYHFGNLLVRRKRITRVKLLRRNKPDYCIDERRDPGVLLMIALDQIDDTRKDDLAAILINHRDEEETE